jgi:hypothetical protein
MQELIVEPTAKAVWHRLIVEAEERSGCELDEGKESYLVFLLMRYLQRPDLVRTVLAMHFLHALRAQGRERAGKLQDVGDQCLIYAGLFPEQAERRRVRLSYFVDIGRAAYHGLAETGTRANAVLFGGLADAFVHLMDVLRATRDSEQQALLSALQAADAWSQTGSRLAYRELGRYTDAIPQPAPNDTLQ